MDFPDMTAAKVAVATRVASLGARKQATEASLGVWDAGDDDYQIPPRGWLLGTVFSRRFLSSLLADGGVGKTATRIAQLISLAIGHSLTGDRVFVRCRVLIVSLEDDKDELRRRVYAVLRHHGLRAADVKGWLFLAAPKGLRLAEMIEGAPEPAALATLLENAIETKHIDVVSLDPFVKSHGMEENSNNAIDCVCTILSKIAIEHDCAIDVPHHTKKGAAAPGDSDRGRGASAMKDAARLVYTLSQMTPDEAKQFGIEECERRSLIRIDSAKVNIAPPSREARWFRLIGVSLDNGDELYPAGDNVQTIEPWHPPQMLDGMDSELLNRMLDDLEAGCGNGSRYSTSSRAGDRAAWRVVIARAPTKTEKQARDLILAWMKSGTLYTEEYYDPVARKTFKGVRVNPTLRPS
jgi:AAA domain